MTQKVAPLKAADVGIPPRQLNFRISKKMPKYHYADNVTATCFFALFSAFFPPAEDFFMDAVLHYRHLVKDPELRARVAGFTAQEKIHSTEHDRLNEAFVSQGFNLRIPEATIGVAVAILRRMPYSKQIACVATMEHYTAVLSEEILDKDDFQSNIHPDVAGIWLWHALEELEHKSVTYDVYELVGNSYVERVIASFLVLTIMAPAAVAGWIGLMVQQRVWEHPGDIRAGLKMLLGKERFLNRILRQMPRFFQRGFHPDNHDTTAIETEWRERLFGSAGTLTDQLRRPLKRA